MKLVEYVETAVNEGATLVHGGKRCDMPGISVVFFFNCNNIAFNYFY